MINPRRAYAARVTVVVLDYKAAYELYQQLQCYIQGQEK